MMTAVEASSYIENLYFVILKGKRHFQALTYFVFKH